VILLAIVRSNSDSLIRVCSVFSTSDAQRGTLLLDLDQGFFVPFVVSTTLGKYRGNELERVYFARAMRVKRLAAFRRGEGDEDGDVATWRRIVCKNLVKSLTKRQSD